MDDLFETELETSDKEAENYNCAICQKMYIDNTELIEHVELFDVEINKESEEDRENVSCPYFQKLFSNSTWRCTKLTRKTSLPSAENFLDKVKA